MASGGVFRAPLFVFLRCFVICAPRPMRFRFASFILHNNEPHSIGDS
jgi:hypothetical protein